MLASKPFDLGVPRALAWKIACTAVLAALLGLGGGCSGEEASAPDGGSGRDAPGPASTPDRGAAPGGADPAPAASSVEVPAEAPAMASLEPDAAAGKQVYATYCQTCHGAEGRGDGPGAAALDPKPRDFVAGVFSIDANGDGTTGTVSDLRSVVKNGAAAYGGSPLMVAWGAALTNQQIVDVVAYVRSLGRASGSE